MRPPIPHVDLAPFWGAALAALGAFLAGLGTKWADRWSREAIDRRRIRCRMLRQIPPSMPCLVFAHGLDHTCQWVWARGNPTDGYPFKWMVGHRFEDLMQGSPQVVEAMNQVLAGFPEIVSYTWGATGHPWRSAMEPLRDKSGAVVGLAGVAWRMTP